VAKHVKPVIAVDCDDVVANINDAVRLFVNETYDTNHSPEDYRVTGSYRGYWDRIWGTPEGERSDRFEKFIASGRMATLKQVPDAIRVLGNLKKRFDLVMVTARSAIEVNYTHTWLENNAPAIFNEVTFMHLWDNDDKRATKADICRKIGANYLIDDNFDHCRLAAEFGVQALLFGDYGWNRAQKLALNMTRVADWVAVEEYFDGR
jgi:hypothetical protein